MVTVCGGLQNGPRGARSHSLARVHVSSRGRCGRDSEVRSWEVGDSAGGLQRRQGGTCGYTRRRGNVTTETERKGCSHQSVNRQPQRRDRRGRESPASLQEGGPDESWVRAERRLLWTLASRTEQELRENKLPWFQSAKLVVICYSRPSKPTPSLNS